MGTAFASGVALGERAVDDRRQRKEMLSDEQRQLKVRDLYEQRNAIREKLSDTIANLKRDSPEYKQAYDEAQNGIADIQTQLEQLYHPINAPGALQKDWNFLAHLITRRGQEQHIPPPAVPAPATVTQNQDLKLPPGTQTATVPSQPATPQVVRTGMAVAGNSGVPGGPVSVPIAPPSLPAFPPARVGIPVSETMAVPTAKIKGLIAPGNIPIWNRPTVKNDDGSHSSEYSTSFVDENPKSPYYGKEVLVPTVVAGKFLTPDGKKPPEGSPQEKAMMEAARKHYEQTGQHLGVFDSPQSADKYANTLHTRGEKQRPGAAEYIPKPTAAEKQAQKQREQGEKDAAQFLAAMPLAPGQALLTEARAQVAAQRAKIDAMMEDYDENNKGRPPEEREAYRRMVAENVFGFKSALAPAKWDYKTGKINGKPVTVRYNEKDPNGGLQFADGTPVPPDQAAAFTPDPTKAPPSMKFMKDSNQVYDAASGKYYNEHDPTNPPEVQAMFRGHEVAKAEQEAYGMRLAQERGQSYNASRWIAVYDTANGNAPTEVQGSEFLKNPGRYIPTTAGAKALAQQNLFEDIKRTSAATRDAINGLTEDFPEDMKAKISVALTAEDHGNAMNALLASAALSSLKPDQFQFLVATRQLAENAMAMRSVLNAGQGSEDVRRAIQGTLPSLLSPNRSYALMQLDAFDKTLEQLHKGVPKVSLGNTNWQVNPTPGAGGGGGQPQKVHLSLIMDRYKKTHPDDKNPTKEKAIADFKLHGNTADVVDDLQR